MPASQVPFPTRCSSSLAGALRFRHSPASCSSRAANAAADATTIANRLLDYFNALAAAATKTTMSDMRAAISSANQTGTAIDAALATFQADLGIGSASPSPS